jgi:Ca2+/Na+ antiporter
MREKISLKVTLIVAAYVLLLAICLCVYHSFPAYRKQMEFWIPQIFLLIMIVVTTLYVYFTATLVEETRRLQDRPLLRLEFSIRSDLSPLKMNTLFDHAQNLMRGVVAKIVGGEELQVQPSWLVIELNNIGRLTVRTLSIRVLLKVAGTESRHQQDFSNEIPMEGKLQITISPASLPWFEVQVQEVIYGDGMRKYTDFLGDPKFTRTVG